MSPGSHAPFIAQNVFALPSPTGGTAAGVAPLTVSALAAATGRIGDDNDLLSWEERVAEEELAKGAGNHSGGGGERNG